MDRSRVLVLGFDGASPRLIDELIEDLPAFRFLRENGAYGETIPPVPAQTPVAWTTFMTGNNPGNHGIFSFAMRRPGTYERDIVHPQMVSSKTIPEILTEGTKRVVIINVPMTDANAINGVVVPGFMSRRQGVAHPHSTMKKILHKFNTETVLGDLDVETLERVETEPELFFEKVSQITDQLAEVSLWLSQEEEWDFFMVVFMGLDRVQHFFWRYIDPAQASRSAGKFNALVKRCYHRFDKIVSDFVRSVDDDTFLIVLSDHGFCPVHAELIVNDYLQDGDFLTEKSRRVDVQRSQAVSYGYGDIWLNVKGREPAGIVNPGEDYETTRTRITECLKEITVNGEKAVRDVKRREELWWGTYLDRAPDLTAIFKVGFQAARRPEITGKNEPRRHVNHNPRWSGGHDGTHDPEDVPGMIGIIGPGMPKGLPLNVHLWDLAPTILRLMKLPTPSGMDGKPLQLQE